MYRCEMMGRLPYCVGFSMTYYPRLIFWTLKKNSRYEKLKTHEKNSKLKLKIQISGTYEEKRIFVQ